MLEEGFGFLGKLILIAMILGLVLSLCSFVFFGKYINKFHYLKYGYKTDLAWVPIINYYFLFKMAFNSFVGWLYIIINIGFGFFVVYVGIVNNYPFGHLTLLTNPYYTWFNFVVFIAVIVSFFRYFKLKREKQEATERSESIDNNGTVTENLAPSQNEIKVSISNEPAHQPVPEVLNIEVSSGVNQTSSIIQTTSNEQLSTAPELKKDNLKDDDLLNW